MGRNDIFLSEMRAKVCVLLGSFRAVPNPARKPEFWPEFYHFGPHKLRF